MTDWSFDAWPAVDARWYDGATLTEWDRLAFHVDLGCGTLKKGRIGIDRYAAPGVNIVMDLETGIVYSEAEHPGEDAPAPHWPIQTSWGRGLMQTHAMTRRYGLPFEDGSIESIVSHHALEHIGEGFLPLMDDVYRVLKPGGIFRVIVPLFPSYAAVQDPDHCRYFMEGTFDCLCGTPDAFWSESFSVPYTKARFEKLSEDCTPRVEADKHWTREDAREMRVTLRAVK